MLELFLVSVVYWASLLAIFLLLDRRVRQLSERLALLEREKADRKD